jgi:hypothetical protein
MSSDCGWEEIPGFRSLDDYKRALARLNEQVVAGEAAAVDLNAAERWGTAFDEHWFQCSSSGEIWRLVGPDPPFRGIFKPLRHRS